MVASCCAVGNVKYSKLQSFRAAPEGSARLHYYIRDTEQCLMSVGFSCQDFPACEEETSAAPLALTTYFDRRDGNFIHTPALCHAVTCLESLL